MVHHRCTRCKQESYPRHKWHGGVFCDDCIRWIRGFRPHMAVQHSWLRRLWARIADFASVVVQQKRVKRVSLIQAKVENRARQSQYKAVQSRARDIPASAQSALPQNR